MSADPKPWGNAKEDSEGELQAIALDRAARAGREQAEELQQELGFACAAKNIQGVMEALRRGANPDLPSGQYERLASYNESVIFEVARDGWEHGLAALIPVSKSLRAPKGKRALTPLMGAAMAGSAVCVSLLLPHSDPLGEDDSGQSALMHASAWGALDSVRLLLPVSDPLALNISGRNALMLAAAEDWSACVEALLPVSDPLERDTLGMSALMHAASSGSWRAGALLLPVSDPRLVSLAGDTALTFAARAGSKEMVDLLLPHSDLLRGEPGARPHEHAQEEGHNALASYLLALYERETLKAERAQPSGNSGAPGRSKRV